MTSGEPVTAFVSYSWDNDDHKRWVRELAARLRADGVTVALDQWELVPGDQLPEFMERSIRDSNYVLIICTPGYKRRAEKRQGGVGYEGDIITSELLVQRNQRKFIPVLRRGIWDEAAPSWVKGKYYVDLSAEPYAEPQYVDLLTTLLGTRPQAPPVGTKPTGGIGSPPVRTDNEPEPIRIKGIVVDKVSMPRRDGSRGSALYHVPFKLSEVPSRDWAEAFIRAWNQPPQFTTMHRPGIASIEGDIVWLRGTTLEEVEQYHRDTLVLAKDVANEKTGLKTRARQDQERIRAEQERAHRQSIEDGAKRIKFD